MTPEPTPIRLGLVLALMVALAVAHSAWSDGSHNTKVDIKNESGLKITAFSYNGKDIACTIPHKSRTIKNGETKTLKCHGQGKGQCLISIHTVGICGAVKDNYTCTYSGGFELTDCTEGR